MRYRVNWYDGTSNIYSDLTKEHIKNLRDTPMVISVKKVTN